MAAPKKRAATNVHPKVVAGAVGGGAVVAALAIFGLDVSDPVAALIAAVASAILGYLKSE